MKIYLAHPFDKRFEIREKELEFESMYHQELINPFYDMNKSGIDETSHDTEKIYQAVFEHYKEVVEGCLEVIDQSDMIIAYVFEDVFSIGTLQEIIYAKLKGKKVYIISRDEKVIKHCWINYFSDGIYPDLFELMNNLNLGVNTYKD
jgi:nucleoside 2-deoxyribosyltransferase